MRTLRDLGDDEAVKLRDAVALVTKHREFVVVLCRRSCCGRGENQIGNPNMHVLDRLILSYEAVISPEDPK